MASGGKAKFHRTVLNRCLPSFVRDLDFKAVSIYIYQKELFDDITFRDISEQRVTSDKIRELIHRLQQRDENTYGKFKECLVQSKQEYLKDILEKEETKVYMEFNTKQEETLEKKNVPMAVKEKPEIQHTGTTRETKTEDSFTMEVDTDFPVTIDKVVIKFDDETSHESGSGPVACSSIMHNIKSYNDIHEGKGKEGIGEPSLTPASSSILFMDGKIVLKEHYDVCIIFSDKDEDDVYIFIEHLERIDLGGKEYPKICRFDDEGIWGLATRINRVPLICKHCSVIFVFVSKTGFSDSYTKFFQDEVVMSSLKNCKVRPVLAEENCSIPAGMQNIPPIKWYRRDTRAYQENIKSILDYSRKARLHRENNHVQTVLPDF